MSVDSTAVPASLVSPAAAADSPQTLADWLAHLESLHPRGQAGIELGLERVERMRDALGQVPFCPLIIVGGTNGKGSTCAYLEAIYGAAGYRTGCYSSPHLLDYNERVRIGGVPASDTALIDAFARVEAARQAADALPLTYFEFGTLAAWEAFAAAAVDVLILEVGLGGRLDAVNAYAPDCAIVTGVALDHTDWLGPTREAIGCEKAGIFRPATPAICADPEPPQSLLTHAQEIGAQLLLIGRDFGHFGGQFGAGPGADQAPADSRTQWTYWLRQQADAAGDATLRRGGLAPPALRGARQLDNAAAALTAVELLRERLPMSMQAVRRGLIEIALPGRFQIIPGRPALILDVAHNPQAVEGLARSLGSMGFFRNTLAVVGMLADKDIAATLAPLAGKIDRWLLADLDGPRAAPAAALAAVVNGSTSAGKLGGEVECFDSPAAAYARARKLAGEDDRIVAFGSFLTVAAVMRELQRLR